MIDSLWSYVVLNQSGCQDHLLIDAISIINKLIPLIEPESVSHVHFLRTQQINTELKLFRGFSSYELISDFVP